MPWVRNTRHSIQYISWYVKVVLSTCTSCIACPIRTNSSAITTLHAERKVQYKQCNAGRKAQSHILNNDISPQSLYTLIRIVLFVHNVFRHELAPGHLYNNAKKLYNCSYLTHNKPFSLISLQCLLHCKIKIVNLISLVLLFLYYC